MPHVGYFCVLGHCGIGLPFSHSGQQLCPVVHTCGRVVAGVRRASVRCVEWRLLPPTHKRRPPPACSNAYAAAGPTPLTQSSLQWLQTKFFGSCHWVRYVHMSVLHESGAVRKQTVHAQGRPAPAATPAPRAGWLPAPAI